MVFRCEPSIFRLVKEEKTERFTAPLKVFFFKGVAKDAGASGPRPEECMNIRLLLWTSAPLRPKYVGAWYST